MRKKSMLLGASALIAAGVALAGSAGAAVTTQVYGGGSTLLAPYLRQAEDCYGNPTDLINKGSDTMSPTSEAINPFNYTGSPPFNCATTHVDPTFQLNYMGTGSGTGINGLYSHDPVTFFGKTISGNTGSDWTSIQYAASDYGLAAADVAVWNNGGTEGSVTVVAPGQTPGTGQYPSPLQKYGNLVQFPLLVAPVVIAYSPVYKKVMQADGVTIKSYSLHIRKPNANGSGGLVLNELTLCQIFNGQITNWNAKALKVLNGNVSLQDPQDAIDNPGPWSLPLQIVGRSDGSGTTSIFMRHLGAVCGSVTGNQYTTAGGKNLPLALTGPAYNKALDNNTVTDVPGEFTVAAGNDGTAKYVAFYLNPTTKGQVLTQGRITYNGPDYVLPSVNNTGANTYGLNTALIQVLDTTVSPPVKRNLAPTPAAALLAFGTLQPPQSNSDGTYSPSTGTKMRVNPGDWAEPLASSSPLADPTLINPRAYPLVGTSNFEGYTCINGAPAADKLEAFLYWYMSNPLVTSSTLGVLNSAGFAPLPRPWRIAIEQTFLAPTHAGTNPTAPLNLNILASGAGPASGTDPSAMR